MKKALHLSVLAPFICFVLPYNGCEGRGLSFVARDGIEHWFKIVGFRCTLAGFAYFGCHWGRQAVANLSHPAAFGWQPEGRLFRVSVGYNDPCHASENQHAHIYGGSLRTNFDGCFPQNQDGRQGQ